MSKIGYVYIMFNKPNGTLYTGVTSDIVKRVYEHKTKLDNTCFTYRYQIDKLGYYEIFDDIITAIEREKKIKAGTRKSKINLIKKTNPNWNDLYDSIL